MKKILFFILFALACYGANLLYYELTDGFKVSNIESDFSYDSRFDTRPLSPIEKEGVAKILDQKFTYLGKGCQAYVFASEDGQHVLKFFKYQRYRIKPWVEFFSFIPFVENHKQKRIAHKKAKLERFFKGWEVAFDDLQKETGLIYVHLNKTHDLNQQVVIVDKMGYEHSLDIDKYEFLIQKRAVMFTDEIARLEKDNQEPAAKALITAFIQQLLSEYQRGLVDTDHAIMQNTGVYQGQPIHIDVGQFTRNPEMRNPSVYTYDLFNKTYKFRQWLREHYPKLADFTDKTVYAIIGPEMDKMVPYFETD